MWVYAVKRGRESAPAHMLVDPEPRYFDKVEEELRDRNAPAHILVDPEPR